MLLDMGRLLFGQILPWVSGMCRFQQMPKRCRPLPAHNAWDHVDTQCLGGAISGPGRTREGLLRCAPFKGLREERSAAELMRNCSRWF
jgi:hypothetical protein